MLPLASSLLIAVLGGLPGAASKAYYPLADKVDDATFICVGRVTDVVELATAALEPSERWGALESMRFARVEVERLLEGDPATRVVYHEAWSSWACDTTSAHEGERVLLFLGPGAIAGETEPVRERVRAALGGELPLRNVGSGDGIVVLEDDGTVECSGAPSGLPRLRDEVPIADLLAYVEEVLHFAPDALAARIFAGTRSTHAVGGSKARRGVPFDLRVLPDGRARLARDLGVRETRTTFAIAPARWIELRRELDALARGEQRVVGDPKPVGGPSRLLRLRLGKASLAFTEGRTPSVPPRDSAERAPFEDALRAWDLLRDSIDCLECVDHAERDREVLEDR